jgi:PII-like signaling protein
MMADPEEVEMLEARDIVEYGSADGPTFEFLVKECQEAGLKGNAVYEAIIQGSYRTNKGVNDKFGL